jgi:beta-lactamase superfamily II metal-dependent hydrolase
MADQWRSVNVDLVKVYAERGSREAIHVLAWGDRVRVHDDSDPKFIEIVFDGKPAYLRRKAGQDMLIDPEQSRVLKVDFVDVQQGDGAVIETPEGKIILIDAGDNQLFARYLAARFRRNTAEKPRDVACIIVTHGDADHYLGLHEIFKSETHADEQKRLFIRPRRLYHNGLVKRPTKGPDKKKVPDEKLLGATENGPDGKLYIVGLENDLLAVDPGEMNEFFKRWREALAAWRARGDFEIRRIEFGDDDAFSFLQDEGIRVQVLGPITEQVGDKRGLPFLGEPPSGPRIGHDSVSLDEIGSGHSASHTINGHSIVFRMTYGSFNFLFSGDLNDQSGRILARAHNRGTLNLQAEVLKVPHHGSADFSGAFIQAVSPVVSVVSSGDESAVKEYIHPRATLMGALGRFSRVDEPLVFCTELVAFFARIGPVTPECHEERDGRFVPLKQKPRSFYAFERMAYGIVKIRTDGQRLLVFTNSGLKDLKEAYAYSIDDWGKPAPAAVRQA